MIKSNQFNEIKSNKKLYSQSKFLEQCSYSVVYISGKQVQKYLLNFNYVLKKNKENKKNKKSLCFRLNDCLDLKVNSPEQTLIKIFSDN